MKSTNLMITSKRGMKLQTMEWSGKIIKSWAHNHVALLGIAFFYFAVRIFNFSTFKEYAEDRKKLLHRLRG